MQLLLATTLGSALNPISRFCPLHFHFAYLYALQSLTKKWQVLYNLLIMSRCHVNVLYLFLLMFFIISDYNDLFVFCVDLNYFFMMEVINPWIVFVLLFWTFIPSHLFWREFILNAIYVNRFDATSNITLLHLFALVC